jgi:hypothetical protein
LVRSAAYVIGHYKNAKELISPHQKACHQRPLSVGRRREEFGELSMLPRHTRVHLVLLLHEPELASSNDVLCVARRRMESFDHIESFLTPSFREKPTWAEGDNLASGEQDKRKDDLERQRKSPGKLCGWIIGRHVETGKTEPASKHVTDRVHDASDADHGSSGF